MSARTPALAGWWSRSAPWVTRYASIWSTTGSVSISRVPQADPTRGGYGLAGTRARLAELGGGLDVESAPGSGTAVSAYLPLTRYAAPASTPERAQI